MSSARRVVLSLPPDIVARELAVAARSDPETPSFLTNDGIATSPSSSIELRGEERTPYLGESEKSLMELDP